MYRVTRSSDHYLNSTKDIDTSTYIIHTTESDDKRLTLALLGANEYIEEHNKKGIKISFVPLKQNDINKLQISLIEKIHYSVFNLNYEITSFRYEIEPGVHSQGLIILYILHSKNIKLILGEIEFN